MRYVILADTHYGHGDIDMPDGDVLLFVGDMCWDGNKEEVKSCSEWLKDLDFERKFVVAGNHDWPLYRADEPRDLLPDEVVYLEDDEVDVEGLKLYGSPWTPEFCGWAFMKERGKEIRQVWNNVSEDVDILATHGPPKGILDRVPANRFSPAKNAGCGELRGRVEEVRPRLHVFGHIHEAPGVVEKDGIMFANVNAQHEDGGPFVFDINDEEIQVIKEE